MKIVIADDDSGVARFLLRILKGEGHQCIAVSSGKELAQQHANRKPRAIISDVSLGDVDGISICRGLREVDSQLLIVIMSGDPFSLQRAREDGFHYTLRKPFTLREVKGILSRLKEACGDSR